MGRDEHRRLPQGVDIFVEQLEVHAGRTLDDDNRPIDATVILEVQSPQPPVRLHFRTDAIEQLATVMQRVARQADEELSRDHRRPST